MMMMSMIMMMKSFHINDYNCNVNDIGMISIVKFSPIIMTIQC